MLLTIPSVRGGRVRILLALAATGVVGAIGVSVGSSSHATKQSAVGVGATRAQRSDFGFRHEPLNTAFAREGRR